MYIKDLRIFSNRDISKIVLVDNAAHSFYFQLANGIPIVPYYFNKKDT
jgi:CTD small phosphatase-like protein 2